MVGRSWHVPEFVLIGSRICGVTGVQAAEDLLALVGYECHGLGARTMFVLWEMLGIVVSMMKSSRRRFLEK